MPAKMSCPRRVMTEVAYKNMRFVVFDAPTDSNAENYLNDLLTLNVTDVVRFCDPSYNIQPFTAAGINVTDMGFADGAVPPQEIVRSFLDLCTARFFQTHSSTPSAQSIPAIGVHCVAGLGRAPMLVVIALIESGLSPFEAVEYVRARRRGALNTVQLNYIVKDYKRLGAFSSASTAGNPSSPKFILNGMLFGNGLKKDKRVSLTPSLNSGESVGQAGGDEMTSFDVELGNGGAGAKNGGMKGLRGWWFGRKAGVAA
ncbi:protein-tyrosine phosphatase-like protein [Chytriomyces cf. hyalinus JEL632]|nr:protein-tyrosine phosphatase-like protein [Chytriomyces cf. hyalinus JEL632]